MVLRTRRPPHPAAPIAVWLSKSAITRPMDLLDAYFAVKACQVVLKHTAAYTHHKHGLIILNPTSSFPHHAIPRPSAHLQPHQCLIQHVWISKCTLWSTYRFQAHACRKHHHPVATPLDETSYSPNESHYILVSTLHLPHNHPHTFLSLLSCLSIPLRRHISPSSVDPPKT